MTRIALLAPLLALTGCDLFEQGRELFDDLTNPLVALGLVLGVEEPPEGDLAGTEFEPGTSLALFLADASSVDDLEQAPVSGATARLQQVTATEAAPGVYAIDPTNGPAYAAGAVWSLRVAIGDSEAEARITLPDPVDFDAPDQHEPNTALSVDLTGQGYDGVVAVVIEVSSGEVTWSSQPETIVDVYELTHGSAEVGLVEIPASAFPGEDVYLVGVAGLQNTPGEGIEGVNSVLSSFVAGQLVFDVVSTVPLDT